MRDIVFNYKRDQLAQHSLSQLAGNLTGQLLHELRHSPDGLTIRYPAWLYQQLAGLILPRFTIVNIMGASDTSTLRHLQSRERVTLWLIEQLFDRSDGFADAVNRKLVHVTVKDSPTLVRLSISWDTSLIKLHELI